MGVKGLTPFLKKLHPDLFKHLPNRFAALKGKKIVIDGTLVTQRFHFARIEHPYRHVLGWYKLIHELKENGVSAICVFDGKERSAAKLREVQRREAVRQLTRVRGSIEQQRFERLNDLQQSIRIFQSLSEAEQHAVLIKLDKQSFGAPDDTAKLLQPEVLERGEEEEGLPPVVDSDVDEEVEVSISTKQASEESISPELEPEEAAPIEPASTVQAPKDVIPATLPIEPIPGIQEPKDRTPADAITAKEVPIGQLHAPPDETQSEEHSAELAHAEELPVHAGPSSEPNLPGLMLPVESIPEENVASGHPIPGIQVEEAKSEEVPMEDVKSAKSIDLEEFAAHFQALKIGYQAAAAHLSTCSSVVDVPSTEDATSAENRKTEKLLTKFQNELTIQEEKVWSDIVTSLVPSNPDVEEDINSLLSRTHTMAESFQRRSDGPTAAAYQECKEIIKAMGIPCIDATGAIEGEGLASKLVLDGLADYVASEDTDVLVYDAPLVKNVTSATEPLIVVSGSDIRSVLDLDRSAFIDFALLLGTDFTERINNVGPVRAYQLIKDHGCIEDVLEAIKDNGRYKPKIPVDAYLAQIRIARSVYNTLPLAPPVDSLKPTVTDEEEVSEILERYDLTRLVLGASDSDHILGATFFDDKPEA
ncbi:PIN domain-like protein [Agrocybe pediades]|nr:PIN domain-like protein [Agrocybe pediades]